MSSPISPGLHQGLEALRRWTSDDSNDTFQTQMDVDAFPCDMRNGAVDLQVLENDLDPLLHTSLPFESASEAALAGTSNPRHLQFTDAEQHARTAWDAESSLRDLFPGIDCTPDLGSYTSPTTTSMGTPTSTFNRAPQIYPSAVRQDLTNDLPTPEPSDHGYEAAESPYRSYAQLLFQCLYEAYNFERSLKDIYRWMQDNAKKGRAGESAGWMNSVRHNLSMNAAFQRVPNKRSSSKKDSTWRLTSEAIANGIFSTTRYRTKEPKKSTKQVRDRDSKRVAAGAKGGLASRRSAESHRRQHAVRKVPSTQNVRKTPLYEDMLLSSMPAFLPSTAPQSFDAPCNYGQVDASLPTYFNDSSTLPRQLLTPTSLSATDKPDSDETGDMCYAGQGPSGLIGQAYSDAGFGLIPLFDGQFSPPFELQ